MPTAFMDILKKPADLKDMRTIASIAGTVAIFLVIPLTVLVGLQARELKSRAAVTPEQRPRGLFVPRAYSPGNPDNPFNIDAEMLNNPLVDGFSIVVQWNDIEPTRGSIATRSARLLSDINNKIASPSDNTKKVVLRFRAGGDATPDYILDDTPGVVKLSDNRVAPWDMTYLGEWARVLRALGDHYSGKPWLSRVNMSGPTRTWDEVGPADLSPAEFSNWKDKGYTTDGLKAAWSFVVGVYKEAFPNEYLAMAFRPVVPSEADPENPKPEFAVARAIAEDAITQLGARFVFQNSDFSDQNPDLAKPENPYTQMYNYMKEISCNTPTGLQVGEGHMSGTPGDYQTALERFAPLQLRYLETTEGRINNNHDILSAFRDQLLINPTDPRCSAGDTEAPTVPARVNIIAFSPNRVHLLWDPSTDNVGVAGYKIFRNGEEIGTSQIPSFSDTNLNPETTYSYEVSAFDAVPNNSNKSAAKSVVTPAISPPQSMKPFPRGIIRVAGFGNRAEIPPVSFFSTYPWVQGFGVIEYWSALQPTYNGEIDWSYLDSAVARAADENVKKPVIFIIHTGGNKDSEPPAPTWLRGAPLFRPSLPIPPDWTSMVPWDPVMREHWLNVSALIAARYDNNPWVAGIYVAGVNARYPEMIFTDSSAWVNNTDLPPTGIKASIGPNNEIFDVPNGSVYSGAWLDSLQTMATQFKKTRLINMVDGVRNPTGDNMLYGPLNTVVDEIKNTYPGRTVVTATLGSNTDTTNYKFQKISEVLDFTDARVVYELGPLKFSGESGQVYNALSKCRVTLGCWAAITHAPTWAVAGYPGEMEQAFNDFWKKEGDLNNDGKVDNDDLLILINNWGATSGGADINNDGKVDILDLSMLLTNWGS